MNYLRQPSLLAVALVGVLVALATPIAASADPSNDDTVNAGTGTQYAYWHKGQQHTRFQVITGAMSTDRCQDSMVDWHTDNDSHYDARVDRDCKPGSTNTTYGWHGDEANSYADLRTSDPYWDEPAPDFNHVDDMQRGAGYVLDDDFANGTFAHYDYQLFQHTSGASMANWWSNMARTCTDKGARVWTLYQDGHYLGCKNFPANQWN